jgi:hypothetical protein
MVISLSYQDEFWNQIHGNDDHIMKPCSFWRKQLTSVAENLNLMLRRFGFGER